MSGQALVSVHDVMPSTLPRVLEILDLLEEAAVRQASLLVVPGAGWTSREVGQLKDLESRGYPLAAHGWNHRAPKPTTLHHHLHSLVISRDQGEHLSRTSEELRVLLREAFLWFQEHGLTPPSLYVPPAWAMGALTSRDLVELPFKGYEVLTGFVDGATGRLHPLPLVGFEADTPFRKCALKVSNRFNLIWASLTGSSLRISIHPGDLDLLLEADLRRLVDRPWDFLGEEALLKSWTACAPEDRTAHHLNGSEGAATDALQQATRLRQPG